MKKGLKITLSVVVTIIVLIGAFLLWWFVGDSYKDFYGKSTKGFAIPGLDDGFIPQGFCYVESDQTYLISGYMNDGSASRVYVVKNNQTEKYFTLKNTDNTDYVGHAGGIDTNGESVWVAGDKKVNRFGYPDIALVENGESINIVDTFDPKNGADFVTVQNDILWIGEFYHAAKYKTPESHHITTPSGEVNHALTFGYTISNGSNYGISSTTPVKAISMPAQVQGMAITADKIYLSTSYSLPNSVIYEYANKLNSTTSIYEYAEGEEISLLILDKADLTTSTSAPCMSEEIVIVDGKLCVLFENACAKYKLFTREKSYNVYLMTI